jgi:primosomal protein N'
MVRHKLDSVSDFARQGYNLRIRCQACEHVVDASAMLMMQEIHRKRRSQQIASVERALNCSNCGERKAHVTPVPCEF